MRGHSWLPRYRSGQNDVVAEFYVPAYRYASRYCRAAGYFTSRSLALIGRGLNHFTDHGGTLSLIASPQLEAQDLADIARGYEVREVFERATLRIIDVEADPALLNGLGLLGQLIAIGLLDIKLAFLQSDAGFGIYHEKLGYFEDARGDIIAFTGSSNETFGGLSANFESIEVYQSWLPSDAKRVMRLVKDFDDLWSDATPTLRVIPFPDVARERLVSLSGKRSVSFPQGIDESLSRPAAMVPKLSLGIPQDVSPRPYQRQAVKSWLRNGGRGVFKMATGTGKTKTALFALAHVAKLHANKGEPLLSIIIAPFKHLVDQWINDLRSFNWSPIAICESKALWTRDLNDVLNTLACGSSRSAVVVATNASFASAAFQNALNRTAALMFVVGDEVHNLGAEALSSGLPARATYRLGLSATPERYLDEAGTARIFEYFGPIVFEMTLADAISSGVLCHYEYFPRLSFLDTGEMISYKSLTTSIAQLIAAGESVDDCDSESSLGSLLRRRAAILGHASGKLPMFENDIRRHTTDWFQLIFCAEGHPPSLDGIDDNEPRQVERVLDLVGSKLGMSAHTYVADTSREDRRALLSRFNSGDDLQALISMRCLDEGIDIPDARIGYLLASSTNPRQFIQRRGRLLRKVPGCDKRAVIYDYLAIPEPSLVIRADDDRGIEGVERSLVRREIERASEFAQQADNVGHCLRVLRPLRERFGLMDV